MILWIPALEESEGLRVYTLVDADGTDQGATRNYSESVDTAMRRHLQVRPNHYCYAGSDPVDDALDFRGES
jgi:hypothetical protein